MVLPHGPGWQPERAAAVTAELRSNFEAGHHAVGDAPGAVDRARAVRRGHGQAQDRDREQLVELAQLLQPPRRHRAAAQGGDPRRPAACRSRCAPRRRSDAITSAGAAGQYILPRRDLIASDIEVAVEGALLDGMVCLASCDKTTPGQLMAAGRLNIPTIVVVCGYQPSGSTAASTSTSRTSSSTPAMSPPGAMTVEELAEMASSRSAGPACAPAWAPRTPCTSPPRRSAWRCPAARRCWRTARRCGTPCRGRAPDRRDGRRGPHAAAILTPGAFRNAVTAMLAISGSVNCVKHLQAIAVEAGCDVDVYRAVRGARAEGAAADRRQAQRRRGGSTSSRRPAARAALLHQLRAAARPRPAARSPAGRWATCSRRPRWPTA